MQSRVMYLGRGRRCRRAEARMAAQEQRRFLTMMIQTYDMLIRLSKLTYMHTTYN